MIFKTSRLFIAFWVFFFFTKYKTKYILDHINLFFICYTFISIKKCRRYLRMKHSLKNLHSFKDLKNKDTCNICIAGQALLVLGYVFLCTMPLSFVYISL